MSGNHNMYCSGNQPDIVQRLRDIADQHAFEVVRDLQKEIESLRAQLSNMQAVVASVEKDRDDLRAKIDALEPVVWVHRHDNYPTKTDDVAPGYYGSAWRHIPLYSLEGIK